MDVMEQRYTADERREHTERLCAMVEDGGATWDLSDNDKAALRMALQAVALANQAICSYCGHTGPRDTAAMVEHTLACEKRPEARLFAIITELVDVLECAHTAMQPFAERKRVPARLRVALDRVNAVLAPGNKGVA